MTWSQCVMSFQGSNIKIHFFSFCIKCCWSAWWSSLCFDILSLFCCAFYMSYNYHWKKSINKCILKWSNNTFKIIVYKVMSSEKQLSALPLIFVNVKHFLTGLMYIYIHRIISFHIICTFVNTSTYRHKLSLLERLCASWVGL